MSSRQALLMFMLMPRSLAKAGWLSNRYIQSLHGQGVLQEKITKMLGGTQFRQVVLYKLREQESILLNASQAIVGYPPALITDDIAQKVMQISADLKLELRNCRMLLEAAGSGFSPQDRLQHTDLGDLPAIICLLEEYTSDERYFLAHSDLVEALQTVVKKEVYYRLRTIHQMFLPHNVIVFGDAATGKTHGLANAVENRLEQEQLPAVLIGAKDVPVRDGWGAILRVALGLSAGWAEDEFNAVIKEADEDTAAV